MQALKPVSFGHRGRIGKKAEAKEANRVAAKCAMAKKQKAQLDLS
jgi:hypothetical protein